MGGRRCDVWPGRNLQTFRPSGWGRKERMNKRKEKDTGKGVVWTTRPRILSGTIATAEKGGRSDFDSLNIKGP